MRASSQAFARVAAALGPLTPGRALGPGTRLIGATDGAPIVLSLEVAGARAPLRVLIGPRDPGAPCLAATRSFNVSYHGADLPPAARAVLAALVGRLEAADGRRLPAGAFRARPKGGAAATFDLAVFAGCDNRCLFCANRPRGVRPATLEAICARLRERRTAGADLLELSAMEPTLDRRLVAIVREARRVGYAGVHLVSNGHRLARREVAAGYLAAGLTDVTVSLHSASDETEARLCGRPGSRQLKERALRNLVALGARPMVNTVLTPAGLGELGRLSEQLADCGVERWHAYFPLPCGNALMNFEEAVPRLEALAGPLRAAQAAAAAHGVRLTLVDVPPCVVGDDVAVGRRISKVVATNLTAADGGAEPMPARVHGPPCADCRRRDGCAGIFSAYAERRGFTALRPR
jgi:hypothetical protein